MNCPHREAEQAPHTLGWEVVSSLMQLRTHGDHPRSPSSQTSVFSSRPLQLSRAGTQRSHHWLSGRGWGTAHVPCLAGEYLSARRQRSKQTACCLSTNTGMTRPGGERAPENHSADPTSHLKLGFFGQRGKTKPCLHAS